jgi:hypothetical protein
MNCSPTIAIALMLLSFTAGMFLLYKTQKEALGLFFKLASWFIIVVSLGSIICCSIFCGSRGCGKRGGCEGMEQCEMKGGSAGCEMGGMGHHGMMNKRIMMHKCEGEGGCEMECEMKCEMEGKGCCKDKMEGAEGAEGCKDGEMGCCEKEGHGYAAHDKMKVVKDTVVIKRSTSK